MMVFGTRHFKNERARVRLRALLLFSLLFSALVVVLGADAIKKIRLFFNILRFLAREKRSGSERETEWKRERNGVEAREKRSGSERETEWKRERNGVEAREKYFVSLDVDFLWVHNINM
jgi:hypothetical protein